jgi:hypothetical protein
MRTSRFSSPSPRLWCCLVLTLITFALIASVPAGAQVGGAGFTTYVNSADCNDSPNGINCNNYTSKDGVYMNGGPTQGDVRPAGCYYFAVIVPGFQNTAFQDGLDGNLSDNVQSMDSHSDPSFIGAGGGDTIAQRTFQINADHSITYPANSLTCTTATPYHNTGTQFNTQSKLVVQLQPFDNTTNPGGVYILAICEVGATSPSQCKFDAFRVPTTTPPPPPGDTGFLTVCKYYDANANGSCGGSTPGTCSTTSGGDALIAWDFQYTDGLSDLLLTSTGQCTTVQLPVDTYTVQEGTPTQTNWYNTQPGSNPTQLVPGVTYIAQSTPVVAGQTSELDFGNYCVGAGGGLTLGFWSNKNGQKLETSSDLSFLSGLCLRNANGSNFDPTSTSGLASWLLAANATNMSNMLSAQLTAMELNVRHNFVNGNQLVQTGPDPDNCGLPGWSNQTISVIDLMADANTELCANGYTVAASHDRTCQEFKKTALDRANNNLNFVEGSACTATFDLGSAFPTAQ